MSQLLEASHEETRKLGQVGSDNGAVLPETVVVFFCLAKSDDLTCLLRENVLDTLGQKDRHLLGVVCLASEGC